MHGSSLQLSRVLPIPGTAVVPPVSAAGSCAMYFDGTDLQLSENGGPWTPIASVPSAGGWTDTGTHIILTTADDTISIGSAAQSAWGEKVRITATAAGAGLLVEEGSIRLDFSATADVHAEFAAGDLAAVSAADEGNIRYNTVTQSFQVSEDGGAYTDLMTYGQSGWVDLGTEVKLTTNSDTCVMGADGESGLTEKLYVVGDVRIKGDLHFEIGADRLLHIDQAANDDDGDDLQIYGAQGGDATAAAGEGGAVLIQGGLGGAGTAALVPGDGGELECTGGNASPATAAGGADGGQARFLGGTASGAGTTGGDATLDGGSGATGGTVKIGNTWAAEVQIGRAAIDTSVSGTLKVQTAPVWGLRDSGSVRIANYNAVIDDLVRVNPTAGGFTVTLPTAVGNLGRAITIKEVAGSANAVNVNTTGAQTIDGVAGPPADTIAAAYGAVTYMSDGANWMKFS